MRRITLIILILVSLLLSACGGEDTEVNVEVKSYEMSTIIITAGYNMEQQGYASVFDYHRHEIYDKYELDPDIYILYEGLDDNEEVIILIAFATIEEAYEYANALQNDTEEERLIYQEDQVVLLTYDESILHLYD